jgi:hypothetical protein
MQVGYPAESVVGFDRITQEHRKALVRLIGNCAADRSELLDFSERIIESAIALG